MNKSQFIRELATKSNTTLKLSETMVEAFLDTVTDQLKHGGRIMFQGFGSFEVRKRAARKGVNPQTKERIKISATKVPSFKAGKNFKEAVASAKR